MPQGPHTSRETGQHYQNSRYVASRLRALRCETSERRHTP
jgi:hypothetical protein